MSLFEVEKKNLILSTEIILVWGSLEVSEYLKLYITKKNNTIINNTIKVSLAKFAFFLIYQSIAEVVGAFLLVGEFLIL